MSTTRPHIQTGFRVGKLTVERPTQEWENGYIVWKCRCDCGNEILLQRGKTKSCGCLQVASIVETLKLCEGTSVAILEASRRSLSITEF